MARISEVEPDWNGYRTGAQVFLEYQDSGPQGWYGRSWSRVRSSRNPGRVSELKQVSPVEALLLKLVTRSRLREHLDGMAPRYYYPRRTGGGASTKGPVLRGYEPVAPWHTTATTERVITQTDCREVLRSFRADLLQDISKMFYGAKHEKKDWSKE